MCGSIISSVYEYLPPNLLSLPSLPATKQTISYETLLKELDLSNVRELEDLILEAIYADVFQAKLDQKNAKVWCKKKRLTHVCTTHALTRTHTHTHFIQLEVGCFIGRDIKVDSLEKMMSKLDNW